MLLPGAKSAVLRLLKDCNPPVQVAADEGEVDEQEDVGSLTDFQKVVLCAVVCPNRLAVCVDWLLRRLLGPDVHAEESQAMRLSGTLTDSPPSAPLLLHTWYGEEPARTIQQVCGSRPGQSQRQSRPPPSRFLL